ncbi:cuticle protein 10.9 [Trichonephila clavipes]|nr:cuticle protein 10.9 [Trichonephila clavipes]
MMFKGLLLLSIAAVALAQYGYGDAYGHNDYAQPIPYQYGYDIAGACDHGELFAQPIPYQYGYDIAGDHGEFKQTRQEHGDGHGNVQGSYGYTDAHGIYRQVDYVADAHGFRAAVKTNEPGTESQNPADVELHAQPAQVHQPAYGYGAPAPRHGYGLY